MCDIKLRIRKGAIWMSEGEKRIPEGQPRQRAASKEDMARRIMQTMHENELRERPKKKKKKNTGSAAAAKAKKKSMSGAKAALIAFLIILFIVLLFVGFLYFRGLREAQGKFLQNTTINGVNVSGLNEAEAYRALMNNDQAPESIELIKLDGSKVVIQLPDIGYQDNIKSSISQYLTQQNYYTWFRNLSKNTDYSFETAFTYDKNLLRAELKKRIVDGSGKLEPKDAYIRYTSQGFEIVKEQKGDKIDDSKLDALIEFVEGKLKSGNYTIDLATCDLYQSPKIVAADLTEKLDSLRSLDDVVIGFDFDYEVSELKGTEFMNWVSFEEGNALKAIKVDRDKAMEYVEKLAAKYDTYKTKRKFTSTSRGEIFVDQGEGSYGWWLDQEKMCDYICELIKEGQSVTVDPIYYVSPYSQYTYTCDPKYRTAESDIGDTYCEVDLAMQHFWYYNKGELEYECDIVSGKPTEARNTPGGIYKIWLKEKNKTLTGVTSDGEKWSTPVTYWNNISNFGIGLHDASWHPYFGGERYKTNGSHGCINMPVAAAKYVYDNIPMNTPVIMYW